MNGKRVTVVVLLSSLILGTSAIPISGFTVEESGAPEAPSGGGMGNADTMTYDYSGELQGILVTDDLEADSDSESYLSTESDENVVLVKNGGVLALTNSTLEKSGESANDDNSNFYGTNSILLALNEDSIAYLSTSQLTASEKGSNGLFATDNAIIYANDNTITTEADNSRGVDATYGGTIIANQVTISTNGDHSAALATDRGGGNISVTNSQLSTQGSGSPLLYSTGDIEINNVEGTSSGSQIAGMEGLNSIQIFNSNLTSALTGTTGSDPIANGIIIYQSTSGDAEATTGDSATFEAVHSTLKSATEGTMFYVTNTEANIILEDTELDFDSELAALLTIQGNDANNWGTAGSNGAQVILTGINQELKGKVSVDSISSLNLTLTEGTSYDGSTEITTNEVNSNPTDAPITVNIDQDSKWVVTDDSQVTNLNAEEGSEIIDSAGETVTIVVAGEEVVEGTGETILTVTGSYSTQLSLDDNNQVSALSIDRTDFDDYYQLETAITQESTDTENTEDTEDTTETSETTVSTIDSEQVIEEDDTNSYLWIILGVAVILAGAFVFYRHKIGEEKRNSSKK